MNHTDFARRTSDEAEATRRWCMNSPHLGYANGFGRLALSLDRLAQQEELLAARDVFQGWEHLRARTVGGAAPVTL